MKYRLTFTHLKSGNHHQVIANITSMSLYEFSELIRDGLKNDTRVQTVTGQAVIGSKLARECIIEIEEMETK